MQKKITAIKARQNFGQIMNEAVLKGDEFIVERAGKAMVAIVSMEKYNILQRNREEARTAAQNIRNKIMNANADPQNIEVLIRDAIKTIRSDKS